MLSRDIAMAIVRLKRRDAVMMVVGASVSIVLSVVFSPSPQNCIALTKRILFSSEPNVTQVFQPSPAPPEENSLELRNPLFVAVVVPGEPSATSPLVGSTWGSGQSEVVEMFSVRQLAGDMAKPPQWDDPRLIYRALGLLHDRYLEHRYNWYMVVGGNSYVRINAATQVLVNLNPEEPLFLQREGVVKLKVKKPGVVLSTDRGCVPSTGLIFSRGLLRVLAPAVEDCLGDEGAASWAPDAKMDMERCMSRKLSARCLWNHDLPTEQYFVHTGDLVPVDSTPPPSALVVLGVRDYTQMHALHHGYLKMDLNASETLSQTLRAELSKAP